jgi:5-methylcytosine-specific restriction enzyme A
VSLGARSVVISDRARGRNRAYEQIQPLRSPAYAVSTVFRLGASAPSPVSRLPDPSVKRPRPTITRVPTLRSRLGVSAPMVPVMAPSQTVRIRGRALQGIRRRHLEQNPLCVRCQQLGRVVAATQIDHKKPLWDGGLDVEENRQGLCDECHDRKTAGEAALRGMLR